MQASTDSAPSPKPLHDAPSPKAAEADEKTAGEAAAAAIHAGYEPEQAAMVLDETAADGDLDEMLGARL